MIQNPLKNNTLWSKSSMHLSSKSSWQVYVLSGAENWAMEYTYLRRNCNAYMCREPDSPTFPNNYAIHCKTLVPVMIDYAFFVLQWYHFACSPACQISEIILVMSVIILQKYLKVLQFHKTTKMRGGYSICIKRRFIFWCLGRSERYRTKLS